MSLWSMWNFKKFGIPSEKCEVKILEFKDEWGVSRAKEKNNLEGFGPSFDRHLV